MAIERGISVSGAEFTPSSIAATQAFSNVNVQAYDQDYRYEGISGNGDANRKTFDFLYSRGWRTVKIPIRWERLQRRLKRRFNRAEQRRLSEVLDQAHAAGLQVILDLHNYGLYYVDGSRLGKTAKVGYRFPLGSRRVPAAAFANFWRRAAKRWGSHPAVVGAHIMNEPQPAGGLTRAVWYACAQAAVDAIRAVNTTWSIRVGGWFWSDCYNWTGNNPDGPWIDDPADNLLYEAHHYWATGHDAQYESYASTVADAQRGGYTAGANTDALHTRVLAELHEFTDWLAEHNVRGVVGEVGWPGNAHAGDQVAWNALGEVYLTECDRLGLPVNAWSTGEFYGDVGDPLLIYHGSVRNGVETRRPDAAAWEAHL